MKHSFFKMRAMMRRLSYAAMAVVASAALFACSDDKNDEPDDPNQGNETVDPDAVVKGTMTEARLTGFVSDTDGNPLQGVTVKSGTHSAVTNEAGAFTFSQVDVNQDRSIIEFKKDGYFNLTRAARFSKTGTWNVVMVKKGSKSFTANKQFQSTVATDLKADGMVVDLKANGMKNLKTGAAYTGKVVADMLYLDPNNEHFADMMPGSDLSGTREDGSTVSLVSYGMTAVNLTDESGEPLQLADGTPATLTFPIPEGMEENPHETIPLWSFDDNTGKWVEEGVARLEGNVYVGTVTHFSWVNLDYPAEQAVVSGTVKDDAGKVIANQRVRVGQITVRTDNNGHYSTEVPASTPFKVTVLSAWWGNYSPEVSVSVPALSPRQNFTADITLPAVYHATGRVLENGKPAIAYLWLTVNGTDGQRVATDADGTFSLVLPCNYTGAAVLNVLSGSKKTLDVTIKRADLDLGDITLEGNQGGEQPGSDKEMSPTEAKQYLEAVATDFLNLFKPADQKDLVDFTRHFAETYGDLREPEEWGLDDYDDEDPYFSARNVMGNLHRVAVSRDLTALSRAFDDDFDFKRFAGVYEPKGDRWVKTGNSDDIVFRFKGAKGENCEIKAQGTGGNWVLNTEGGEVRIPENVTVNVTRGSDVMARATVRSNVNLDGHTAALSINAVAANLEVTTAVNGTDSRITQNCEFKVSGQKVLTTTAAIDGRRMLDIDNWQNIIENEDEMALRQMFTKAVAEADLMGRLQVKADASGFSDLVDAMGGYYDSYDYDTQAEAKAACEADAKVINSSVSTALYFNSSVRQAVLWFQPALYDESEYGYSYWEWYIEPVLRFPSDGTTYSFEDYFGNSRFAAVENQWNALVESYQNLWR